MGLRYYPLGSEDSQNESSSSSSSAEDDGNDEVTSDVKQPATVPPASNSSKYSDLLVTCMLVWSYHMPDGEISNHCIQQRNSINTKLVHYGHSTLLVDTAAI